MRRKNGGLKQRIKTINCDGATIRLIMAETDWTSRRSKSEKLSILFFCVSEIPEHPDSLTEIEIPTGDFKAHSDSRTPENCCFEFGEHDDVRNIGASSHG